MRKTLLSLLLLSLAGIASAQETYSVTINLPANVAKLDIGRQLANQALVTRFGLTGSATQADICAASFAQTGQPASGSACTIIEANSLGIRLFPNSLAGREAFINQNLIKAELDVFARQRAKLDFASLQSFCKTATQPQIDGVCTATGLSAGCGVCDSFR